MKTGAIISLNLFCILYYITTSWADTKQYKSDRGEFMTNLVRTVVNRRCNGKNLQVPVSVEAFVLPKPGGRPIRVNFDSSEFTRRMVDMDAIGGDEKGHLIASSFGGLAQWWNLAPQSPWLNRNVGTRSILWTWKEAETKTLEALRGGKGRSARIRVDVKYDTSGQTCRPIAFRFQSQIRDNRGSVDSFDTDYIPNGDGVLKVPKKDRGRRGGNRSRRVGRDSFSHLRWG